MTGYCVKGFDRPHGLDTALNKNVQFIATSSRGRFIVFIRIVKYLRFCRLDFEVLAIVDNTDNN